MDVKTKRRRQLYHLIILSILLAAFCIFCSQAQSNTSLNLTWRENQNLPELHLAAGEIIKGWEKENIVYFFIPAYVSTSKLSLDANLEWKSASTLSPSQKSVLQYDNIQELLLYDRKGNIIDTINVCFQHSENLHTIYINLTGGIDSIAKDNFTKADIRVVNPEGNIEYHESDNSIKGRGNSTWDLEKKPYYIKLKSKAGLCGMEPDRKWLLLANAYEATKLSNKLFYDFSKQAGLAFSANSEWVDLYINGEYRGNYLLCEKIDVETNRVDIANLEQENEAIYKTYEPYTETSIRGYLTDQTAPPNITGGYIIEKDVTIEESSCGFVTDHKNCFVITSPDNASYEEVSYISDCFQTVEDLLEQQDEHVLQHIDTDSFARRFLIEEIALNSDAFITSCYFYKERNDDKIYAGPIWDFDSILGESDSVDQETLGNVWLNYDETTVLTMGSNCSTSAALDWDEQLYEIPAYQHLVMETYQELEPLLETMLYEQIDTYANYIRQSVSMDSIRWNYAENQAGHYSTFDNNIRYMKFFLAKRLNFMNKRFGFEAYPYEDMTEDSHNITCLTENGKVIFSVKDGSLLKIDELPSYDCDKYTGWHYEWDLTPVSEYIPVYEDITLYLNRK